MGKRDPVNYHKISNSFKEFGMPVFDMTEENFLNHPNWDVFTFGLPPSAIDIMVSLKGLDFNECYKKASGRPKDINNLENLL